MASGTIKNPYKQETITVTVNTTDFTQEDWGYATGYVIGNIAYIYITGIKAKAKIPGGTTKNLATFSDSPSKIMFAYPVLDNSGNTSGRALTTAGENVIKVTSVMSTSEYLIISAQIPV